ncbi:hypothetical protein CO058_01675 [candidate division WWE3 bacterium CG_4_9_14_0_2_um_filter_35_11]|uniref:Ribonuclease VapC n=1 Tax=candidate division WWE3 bacterium CG_4_9_14_0_2_um_filter_35_11 TaxID=1975077 RepID=A0A2M8EM12_UNCKA|nr:MAG: hypothetical protein COV25_03970 [candidate division WWE3 bacterium CG10_big_fil_rev_8_21_14_0_10_35_32]PJC23769.1 MAG: hypothetical protein CO058_01675 [candidate division WWE3 bacterium CG_4_9_14_0_2_um_filter_35_11]
MKLIDSNILVYCFNPESKFHEKALMLIDHDNLCITIQNLLETFRVITSATQFEKPITEKLAWEQLTLIRNSFDVLTTRLSTLEMLYTLIGKYKVKSYGIYDANLVAHMVDYGVSTIYTNNPKDFLKFKEIEVTNPFS